MNLLRPEDFENNYSYLAAMSNICFDFLQCTLAYQINVAYQIEVALGIFLKINKRSLSNKRSPKLLVQSS